jgi:ADP-heptose:LPS heptosyltransferase
VEGPARSAYLYEFADEYRVNEPVSGFSDDYRGRASAKFVPVKGATVFGPKQNTMCRPEKKSFRGAFKPNHEKLWRCLAPEPQSAADVLFAFRPVKVFRRRSLTDKEYPIDLCKKLVRLVLDAGFTAACIGGKDNYHIEGTIDLRGTPLEEQCAALGGAKVCVGPSSGPLHLASLCKTPHVTWYNRKDQKDSIARYRDFWNPFVTPFTYMEEQLPSPENVMEALKGYL